MKKIRESNFEIMRIVSMFFIVFYHINIATGGHLSDSTTGVTRMIILLINMVIMVHVNSFALVTGYFQYDKKFSIKKIIDLILMVWVYKIIILGIFYFLGLYNFTSVELIKELSPIEFQNLWFFKTYLALYILSPFINMFIKNIDKKNFKSLLIVLFIMFSIISTITGQQTFTNTGFNILHFIYMYLIGAYLSKYPLHEMRLFKNIGNNKKIIIFCSIWIMLGVFNFLLMQFCYQIASISSNKLIHYYAITIIVDNLYCYQNPILIFQSIAYFMMFSCFKIQNKIINYISSCIFAVYVITENVYIRNNMYKVLKIDTGEFFYGKKIFFYAIICAVLIMIVCISIESIRKLIFGLISKIINFIKKRRGINEK